MRQHYRVDLIVVASLAIPSIACTDLEATVTTASRSYKKKEISVQKRWGVVESLELGIYRTGHAGLTIGVLPLGLRPSPIERETAFYKNYRGQR